MLQDQCWLHSGAEVASLVLGSPWTTAVTIKGSLAAAGTMAVPSRMSSVHRRKTLPLPQTGSSRSCLWETLLWGRHPS